jgi:hypothetical protein
MKILIQLDELNLDSAAKTQVTALVQSLLDQVKSNGSVAPHGLPDLILASSQFLVRISHENKRTMAAACGSLA